jgi:hypothetical protein
MKARSSKSISDTPYDYPKSLSLFSDATTSDYPISLKHDKEKKAREARESERNKR